MQLIEFSPIVTILLDILAWGFFHMTISLTTLKMPERWFEQDLALYRSWSFEKEGKLWNTLFRVKRWKHLIPDGTIVLRSGFNKKTLQGRDPLLVAKFLRESRRAELNHWLSILPSVLFFLWNPLWAGYIMVAYALLFNVPIIIAQRYNRPRLLRVSGRQSRRGTGRAGISEVEREALNLSERTRRSSDRA